MAYKIALILHTDVKLLENHKFKRNSKKLERILLSAKKKKKNQTTQPYQVRVNVFFIYL